MLPDYVVMPSIRQALRMLRRDPGFTFVAICSLALGIGATSAMFSFADEMILRPLPVAEPDRVVTINTEKSAQFSKIRQFPTPTTSTSATGIAASKAWRRLPSGGSASARMPTPCRT